MASMIDWANYNGQPYTYGLGGNSLGNSLYFNAGNIADSVHSDSQTIWEREDSAYQRMVADMQKAGLNPWTGISSGGSSTSSTNPSMDSLTALIQVLGGMLDTEGMANKTNKTLSDMIVKAFSAGLNGIIGRL